MSYGSRGRLQPGLRHVAGNTRKLDAKRLIVPHTATEVNAMPTNRYHCKYCNNCFDQEAFNAASAIRCPQCGIRSVEPIGSGTRTNLIKRDMMSFCMARNTDQQQRCCFYQPSRRRRKCMYFTMDAYCTSLKAQKDACSF